MQEEKETKLMRSFSKKTTFCNNCGKNGHLMHSCKYPIISNGMIVFKDGENGPLYLMICRKDTLGFVEFIRGKYPIHNRVYLQRIIDEMTVNEKQRLLTHSFNDLWKTVWGDYLNTRYQSEEFASSERFNLLKNGIYQSDGSKLTLKSLIENSTTAWSEPEWGFPKGRRNYQENDLDCALREFNEETGYETEKLIVIQNVIPYEEIFMGSNVKTYKHKYYVGYLPLQNQSTQSTPKFQKTEVSNIGWFSFNECIERIRPYNKEKLMLLNSLNETLKEHEIIY